MQDIGFRGVTGEMFLQNIANIGSNEVARNSAVLNGATTTAANISYIDTAAVPTKATAVSRSSSRQSLRHASTIIDSDTQLKSASIASTIKPDHETQTSINLTTQYGSAVNGASLQIDHATSTQLSHILGDRKLASVTPGQVLPTPRTTALPGSQVVAATGDSLASGSRPTSSRSQPRQQPLVAHSVTGNEYETAFSSRPRVPRTPDPRLANNRRSHVL